MKLLISLLVAVFPALLVSAMEAGVAEQGHTHYFKLVANVNGKLYFADRTEFRNWTAAKEYCNQLDMDLATINTVEELNALKTGYSNENFRGGYWTAGRDAQQIRQFTWDTTGEPLSDQFLEFVEQNKVEPQTCITYSSYDGSFFKPGLIYWPCDNEAANGALCELVTK